MAIEWMIAGKPSVLGAIRARSRLVAITPASGFVKPIARDSDRLGGVCAT